MAAPLSTFMTQLLDDSMNHHSNSPTTNLYDESSFSIVTRSGGLNKNKIIEKEEGNVESQNKETKSSKTSELEQIEEHHPPLAPSSVAGEVSEDTPVTNNTTAAASAKNETGAVLDKKALRKCRKVMRESGASPMKKTSVKQRQKIGTTISNGEASLHLSQIQNSTSNFYSVTSSDMNIGGSNGYGGGGKSGKNSNDHKDNDTENNSKRDNLLKSKTDSLLNSKTDNGVTNNSQSNNTDGSNDFNASLSNFMANLLNDADIEKLIGGDDDGDTGTQQDKEGGNSNVVQGNNNVGAPSAKMISKGLGNAKDIKDENDDSKKKDKKSENDVSKKKDKKSENADSKKKGKKNEKNDNKKKDSKADDNKKKDKKGSHHRNTKDNNTNTSVSGAVKDTCSHESGYDAEDQSSAAEDADVESLQSKNSRTSKKNDINSHNNLSATPYHKPSDDPKQLKHHHHHHRRHHRKKNQHDSGHTPTPTSSAASTSVSELSLDEAKECFLQSMAKIDALMNKDESDPYSLVKTIAEKGGNSDLTSCSNLSKIKAGRRGIARHNSDTSLSISVSNAGNGSSAALSDFLHDSNSTQSFSISDLRQGLKKSVSLSHLRNQMTRIQSAYNLYPGTMDLDDDGNDETEHDEIADSSRIETNDDGTEQGDTELEKELDQAIQTDREAEKDSSVSPEKQRRPRSSTPRSRRDKASSTKLRSQSASKSKISPSVDSERGGDAESFSLTERSPSISKKRKESSLEKRGRTPSSRKERTKTSTTEMEKRATSTSRRTRSSVVVSPNKVRSKSVSQRHSRTTGAPAEGEPKNPRKRRESTHKLEDNGHKRDPSRSRRTQRSTAEKEAKRDPSTGRSRRSSRSALDLNAPPATPRTTKSPSTRSRRTARTVDESNAPPAAPSTRSMRRTSITGSKAARSPSTRTKRSGASTTETPSTTNKSKENVPQTPRTPGTPRVARMTRESSGSGRTPRKEKSMSAAARSKSFVDPEPEPDVSKVKLRRNKTIDSLPAEPATPSTRRRSSMTGGTQETGNDKATSKLRSSDGAEQSASRKAKTMETIAAVPATPSVRRRSSIGYMESTPSRKSKEGTNSKDPSSATPRGTPRIVRRSSVSNGSNPLRRQQSDPSPAVVKTAIVAAEAAAAAKEMEEKRVRSRSAGHPMPRKENSGDSSHAQRSKPTNRRETRKRSNMQSQQALRNALVEELKTKERAAENPLAALAEASQLGENGKEATWIARRKNRIFLSQQQSQQAHAAEVLPV